MAKMAMELKPCPFCGGEAELCVHEATGVSWVRCIECETTSGASSEAGAIKAWNKRVGMSYEDAAIMLYELGMSERTCYVIENLRKHVLSDGTELFENGCSVCYGYIGDGDNYCSNCGAKVVKE